MAAPVRRLRVALSSRPWLYWTGVAVLAQHPSRVETEPNHLRHQFGQCGHG
jgi:hypothetical protein